MNIMKLSLSAFAATASVAIMASVPQISNVNMTQDSSRLVTITYTLADAPAVVTLDVQTNANTSAEADDSGWTSIGGVAVCNAMGDVWKKVGESLAEGASVNGTITWHPDHSWPDHKIEDGGARAVVTAWALENTPDYMVVNLAAANTVRYYPSVDFLPGSVLGQAGAITNNPAYKTTQLVMRKIMARGVEWTMGSADCETMRRDNETPHVVTLENNYYIGVFQVTQAQWKNVTKSAASGAHWSVEGDMRPMEKISFDDFTSGFIALLNSKSGLDFTLPSEAQWEFAARSGYGSGYWSNGTTIETEKNKQQDDHMALLGRYLHNNPGGNAATATLAPSEGGTAIVGSYTPNDWGLYDMHGNLWEFCLDFYLDDITGLNGAVNTTPGTQRVVRGGSWDNAGFMCRPACRIGSATTADNHRGFRVVCCAGLR